MRYRILLFALFVLVFQHQAIGVKPSTDVAEPVSPEYLSGSLLLKAKQLTAMKTRDLAFFLDRKPSLAERISFGISKRKIQRAIKKGQLSGDEYIDVQQALRMNWGAFALGCLFGLIGVAIVLLTFEDEEAWKSAFVGVAFIVLVVLVLVIATVPFGT